MDPDRFDGLVRSLVHPASRRRAFGLLAGALATVAPALAAVKPAPAKCLADGKPCAQHDSAASSHHRRGRGKGRGQGHGKRLSCAHCCSRNATTDAAGKSRCACKREGEHCDHPAQCCGGLCRDGVCTGCTGATAPCDGRCVDLQTDDRHCGACDKACDTGQRCDKGACLCDATSCADGCCDGATCARGTSGGACGAGGNPCQRCGAGQRCCDDGCATGDCCGDADCGAHAHCDRHACVCNAGFHRCGDQCASDQEVTTCGTSCTPCPGSVCSPATCDGTTCGRAPIAGCCETDDECGDNNACTTDVCDPSSHTCAHTPNTGDSCGNGDACCGGACCEPPAHASPACNGGQCGFTCKAGFHLCSGQCVSDTDAAHCGDSCAPCPTDPHGTTTCDGTNCVLTCADGYHLNGGACVENSGCATNCSELNFCSGHGICNPDCSCTCIGGYTGAACDNAGQPIDCSTLTTCADCLAHLGDNCIFCSQTIDLASNVCVTTDHCIVPDNTCATCGNGGVSCGGGCCEPPANASPTCDGGTCGFVCNTGWANCDGDPNTGCETPLGTLADCAACGNACEAGLECFDGACTQTCDCANFNNCSGHGRCTPSCTCECDEGWFGITCDQMPVKTCPDFATCGECQSHLNDGCVWCAETLDGEAGVCTTIDNCASEADCQSTATRKRKRHRRRQ